MVYILMRNVRVRRMRIGYSTYTDKKNHGISTDMLAIKWGIRLDRAKRSLQYTTQDNERSDLNPLTRPYRTDLLLLGLRQLNFRFYTDTIFAKDSTIDGNTCDQVFKNGYFVQITPMRYKS